MNEGRKRKRGGKVGRERKGEERKKEMKERIKEGRGRERVCQ